MIEDSYIEPEGSDGEKEEKDPTLLAAAMLIQTSNVERTEREMAKKLGWSNKEAQELVDEAMVKVIGSAPKELRPSFDAVVSYHRWNYLYGRAMKKGNVSDATTAQKQIDNLMARIH